MSRQGPFGALVRGVNLLKLYLYTITYDLPRHWKLVASAPLSSVGAGLTIPPAVITAVVALLTPMLAIALEAVREWLTNHDAKEDDTCSTNNYRNTSMNKETTNSNTLATRFKKHPLCRALGVGFKVIYDTTIAVGASALLTLHRSTRGEPCSPLTDMKSPGPARAFSLERCCYPQRLRSGRAETAQT